MARSELPAGACRLRIVELASARLEAQIRTTRRRRGRLGPAALTLSVQTRGLGGLDSGGVVRVDATGRTPDGITAATSLIVKPLTADAAREAAVYRWLAAHGHGDLAPALVQASPAADGAQPAYLVMERLRPAAVWPWSDPELAGHVLERLAAFHERADIASFSAAVPPSPHALRMAQEVEDTVAVVERSMSWGGLIALRTSRRPLRRVAEAMVHGNDLLRGWLPDAVLHGDLHSGNVVVQRNRAVALLDWTRARVGAPLEDVAAWLQSLAFWESQVRRSHDTLLLRYLAARGLPGPLTDELRDAYWLAAARNAFTGALRYHVTVMEDGGAAPRAREGSRRALLDWFRIIRRADRATARHPD